jgi:hypothetical protein
LTPLIAFDCIENNLLPANQVVRFAEFEINKLDLDPEPVSTMLKTLKKKGQTPSCWGHAREPKRIIPLKSIH